MIDFLVCHKREISPYIASTASSTAAKITIAIIQGSLKVRASSFHTMPEYKLRAAS